MSFLRAIGRVIVCAWAHGPWHYYRDTGLGILTVCSKCDEQWVGPH